MEFKEFLERMDDAARGNLLLVWVDDTHRAFVPMPEPPPVIDPVLEQQRAEEFLDSLRPLWALPEGVIVTQERGAIASGAAEVIVLDEAGQRVPA